MAKRKTRTSAGAFDIENPRLPDWVKEAALTADGFPYDRKLDNELYEKELLALQIELTKLQSHLLATGERVMVLFEGRDGAGKGSSIKRFMAYVNPRHARAVALPKPTEREQGQWYFQRYTEHLPGAGEMVLFDRSWYNRAGVERVMGFCTPEQHADFLREAPQFEAMLVREGIRLFKFYLTIGRETQLKRFHDRRHSRLKYWKISSMDIAALDKWDAYTEARDEMLRFTHTTTSPWTIIRANDKRRARINSLRVVLAAVDYRDKDSDAVGAPDAKIVVAGDVFGRGRAAAG